MKALAAVLTSALAAAALCGGAAHADPVKASATLNCRDTPSAYGTVIASIARGAVVEDKAHAGDWTKVDGEPDCWAASRYLTRLQPAHRARPKTYRTVKPRTLSPAASERASRRSEPKEPLFTPRGFGRPD